MDENFDITRMARTPAVPLEKHDHVKPWVLILAGALISVGLIPITVMLISLGDPSNGGNAITQFYQGLWQIFALPVFIGLVIAALNIRVKSSTLTGEHGVAVGVTIYGMAMVAVPLLIILAFGPPW